jgi:peptidoglycan/xylan/chitin deacetylase (PgdA/CDA1 family)
MMPAETGRVPARQLTFCFHGIGRPGRPLEPGEERFWISPDQFTDILAAVVEHPRDAQLTFDDANESDVTTALPALTRWGLRADFYVIANRLDTTGSLATDHVMALHGAGMTVGTHGMTHRSWRELRGRSEFDAEIKESAHIIEAVTGTPVTRAACPRGQYDRRVLQALKSRGFTRVYSVDGGTSHPSAWLQSRYTVIRDDTPATIRSRLDQPDPALRARVSARARETVKRWR